MTKQNSNGRLINISDLHRATKLDRSTIRERLQAAGVKPRQERAKEKLYDFDEAIAALTRQAPSTSNYNEARTRKTSASAEREWLKYEQEKGELVPIVDIRDYAYRFMKAMRDRFDLYARENKDRLHKEETPNDLERTMLSDFDLIFLNIKQDYPKIF